MSTEATVEKDKTDNKTNETSVVKTEQPKPPKTSSSTVNEKKSADKKSATDSSKNKTSHSTKAGDSKPKKEKKSGGGILAPLSFLLSVAALGGIYWLWQQLDIALDYNQQLSTELTAKMAQTQQSIESSAQSQATKLTGDVQGIEQRQQGIETQLENLLTSIGNTARDWKVSEAQYLLQIANHKLQLQQDVITAITALKLADARIRSTGEPALLPVRDQIAKEITALESYSTPDTVGASLKLSSIADGIPQLPLQVRVQSVGEKTATPDLSGEKTDDIQQLPSAVWDSLKGLISIRYNDRPVEPLLTPTQAANLNENVQLKLEQARLAILQENQTLYQDNLKRAVEWLSKYYQTENDKVKATIAQLTELNQLNVAPQLPDISTSLRDLKKIANKIKLQLDNGNQGGKS